MENIKTFEQVRQDMDAAYNEYLKSRMLEQDRLWELCHQVLSNALFVLNRDEVEDVFTYEFPKYRNCVVIPRLLNLGVGRITKVCTLPTEGVVWFETEDGLCYDDDDPTLPVWEIYNVAVALYMMTEPLSSLLYN